MNNIPMSSLMAIVFGVLILLMPNLLSYLVAIYLIVTGVLAMKRK